MRLILHIGTEKTGTTAFQRWSAEKRSALLEMGVFYSRAMCTSAHSHKKLHPWILGRPDATKTLPEDLAAEVADARARGAKVFVLSSEFCHSRLPKVEQVRRLHDMLVPLFDDITVVAMLRPQIDLAMSRFGALSRHWIFVRKEMLRHVTPSKPYYNYADLDRRWSSVFGSDRVCFLPYRSHPGPGMREFVERHAGVDFSALPRIESVNLPRDIRTTSLTNALFAGGANNKFYNIIGPTLETLPSAGCLDPGKATAAEVQARFHDVNREFLDRHPEFPKEALVPDWSRYGETGNLADLTDLHRQQVWFSELLCAMALKQSEVQMKMCLAEATLALERKNAIAAKSWIHRFEGIVSTLEKTGNADLPSSIAERHSDLQNLIAQTRD